MSENLMHEALAVSGLTETLSGLPKNHQIARQLADQVQQLVVGADRLGFHDAVDCNRFLASAALRFATLTLRPE